VENKKLMKLKFELEKNFIINFYVRMKTVLYPFLSVLEFIGAKIMLLLMRYT
jgi:hypothetical protein